MSVAKFKSFLAAHQAAFAVFIQDCKDINPDELQQELALYVHGLQCALDDTCPRPPPATPGINLTPTKAVIPTRTSTGKLLKIGGTSTVFRTGSGTKRRPPQEDDSSPEATEFNSVSQGDSPPRKKRLVSAAKFKQAKSEETDTPDAGNANGLHSGEKYQGTARRGGSGTKPKRVFKHPYIGH
jgi:hypothetical protein